MNAKFSVGETVIINCEDLPQFNGTEHVVTQVEMVHFKNHDITLICYKLGFTYPWCGDSHYEYWQESTLRKKHQPSEFTFNSLMDNLKLPQKV